MSLNFDKLYSDVNKEIARREAQIEKIQKELEGKEKDHPDASRLETQCAALWVDISALRAHQTKIIGNYSFFS